MPSVITEAGRAGVHAYVITPSVARHPARRGSAVGRVRDISASMSPSSAIFF